MYSKKYLKKFYGFNFFLINLFFFNKLFNMSIYEIKIGGRYQLQSLISTGKYSEIYSATSSFSTKNIIIKMESIKSQVKKDRIIQNIFS